MQSSKFTPDYNEIKTAIQTKPRYLLDSLLKETKADVNFADSNGETLLHWAAQHGKLNNLKLLIKLGATQRPHKNGFYPFHTAVIFDHPQLVRYFVKELKIDANIPAENKAQCSPLHLAAGFGRLNTMKTLTSLNAPYRKDKIGHYPIHRAVAWGHTTVAEFLIQQEESRRNQPAENKSGCTPLHIAAQEGWIDLAKKLFQLGAKHLPNKLGHFPIHEAIRNGHTQFCLSLINLYGIKPGLSEKTICGYTLLNLAASYGNLELTRELCTLGSTHRHNKGGIYPIHGAAAYGHPDVIEFLVKIRKVNVNLTNSKNQRTALSYATQYGHLDTVKKLVALGAHHQTEIKQVFRYTYPEGFPIHIAAQNGHRLLVEYFATEMKIDINLKTTQAKSTVLHMAAVSGNLEMIQRLNQLGATYCANDHGEEPMHIAARNNQAGAIRFFAEEMKGNVNAKHDNADWKYTDIPLVSAIKVNAIEAAKELICLKSHITPSCFKNTRNLKMLSLLISASKKENVPRNFLNLAHIYFYDDHASEQEVAICIIANVDDTPQNLRRLAKDLINSSAISETKLNPKAATDLATAQRQYMVAKNQDYCEIIDVLAAYKILIPTLLVRKNFEFLKLPRDLHDHIFKFLFPPTLRTMPHTLFAASRPCTIPARKFTKTHTAQTHFFQKLTQVHSGKKNDIDRTFDMNSSKRRRV